MKRYMERQKRSISWEFDRNAALIPFLLGAEYLRESDHRARSRHSPLLTYDDEVVPLVQTSRYISIRRTSRDTARDRRPNALLRARLEPQGSDDSVNALVHLLAGHKGKTRGGVGMSNRPSWSTIKWTHCNRRA
jgi:hypothetical protein